MNAPPQTHYTPEQYLEQEREAAYKSEYYGGEIFMMAGGTPNHNRIKENAGGEIYTFLKGKSCRSFSSDQRLLVQETGLYTYSDLMIICGPNQYSDIQKNAITNPVILIEVLSKSTESYDRGEKFRMYRRIPTLQEYVLIDSQRIRAEVFRRGETNFWFIASEADAIDGHITIDSIGLTLPLSLVYADTEDLIPVS